MWRYDYTSDYIIHRVNGSRSEPGIDVYRANSTTCAAASGNAQTAKDRPLAERLVGLRVRDALVMLAALFLVWFCGRSLRRRAARRRSSPGDELAQLPSRRMGLGYIGKQLSMRLPSRLGKPVAILEHDVSRYV